MHRYNQIIGFATRDIAPGDHVHVHNLRIGRSTAPTSGRGARLRVLRRRTSRRRSSIQPATFQGIVRADGRVATRNYIGILSTVNCSATVSRAIAEQFRSDIRPEVLAAIRTSTAWSRSRTAPAAAWTWAKAWTSCAARWRATRGTPTSRRGLHRPRLRGEPDDVAALRRRPEGRRPAARLQHAGHRRHREGDRGASAIVKEMLPAANALREDRACEPPDARACSAAARTATPASPPTRRSATRSTCWSRTAAPRSFPRRPRSTAPSTC